MSVLAAGILALALAVGLRTPDRGRLGGGGQSPAASPASTGLLRLVIALGAGVGCYALVGGVPGLIAGAVVGGAAVRLLAILDDGGQGERRDRLAAQAPEAAELLAACLASGATLALATEAVAEALPEPARGVFAGAAAHLALGAPPSEAWAVAAADPATVPISRSIVRSLESGSPLAEGLSACAVELRGVRRGQVDIMARSVAVKSVGPLGLCFLPAFLLLGVVPLVAGLLDRTMALF